jgi:hypothetical protein
MAERGERWAINVCRQALEARGMKLITAAVMGGMVRKSTFGLATGLSSQTALINARESAVLALYAVGSQPNADGSPNADRITEAAQKLAAWEREAEALGC